jgi:glycosyltransferase involved in cell wall biosynthesis
MYDVSIIIPCFKQAAYLPAAVQSCLDRAGASVQVIVVDDGSPDDTAEVAERFGDRITFVRQPNGGVAAARNAGLKRATGRYIAFLDADDFLLPGMVEAHLAAMRETGADVVCSGWQATDTAGNKMFDLPPATFEPDPVHSFLPANQNPPLCYMFTRAVIDAAGGFDPDRKMSGHEDWDLLLRIAAAGTRFFAIPQVLAAYRFHSESASVRYTSMYDSAIAVLDKTRLIHPPCAVCGTRFRDAYRKMEAAYAKAFLKPALTQNPLGASGRKMWGHFLRRSAQRPSLAMAVVKRFLSGIGRRFRREPGS